MNDNYWIRENEIMEHKAWLDLVRISNSFHYQDYNVVYVHYPRAIKEEQFKWFHIDFENHKLLIPESCLDDWTKEHAVKFPNLKLLKEVARDNLINEFKRE